MSATLANASKTRSLRIECPELTVRREEISFHKVAPERVRVSVTVWNPGDAWSSATSMILQAAPLGAFVPWWPLTTIDLPPIAPYGSIEVSTEAATQPRRTLGDFSDVPPRRLLTAMSSDDDDASTKTSAPFNPATTLLNLLGRQGAGQAEGILPDDPLELLHRPHAHWAGNINVLMGNRAVERHLAQALRIYPGRTNLAIFFVGSKRDAYKFDLSGTAVSWEAALFDMSMAHSLCAFQSLQAIPEGKWIDADGTRMVLLALGPPEYCEEGTIDVHVRQRSTGREAVVEFSLDPQAAGAGCYAV